jgi:hypothetical protein
MFGSNNKFLLKMFPIACDAWTHSDESSRPELQRLWTADASGLAHQIPYSSSHGFYRTCSRWQIELRIFAVCPEVIDPSEKLANDHPHHAQSCRLLNEFPELIQNGLEIGTVGKLDRLSSTLVKILAQGSVGQSAISSASAVLQSADEMEMTELNDPALAGAELDNSRNLVGNRRLNTFVDVRGNGRDCLRPAPHILPSWQEQRIEEHGPILLARLDGHQIQDPIFFSKPEINSVQEQNQRTSRQAQWSRSRHELLQHPTKVAAEALSCKPVISSESFQRATFQHNRFHHSTGQSPSLGSSLFLADAPCTFAVAALTTSRPEAINFRSATKRFRVRRIHARELATH